MSMKQQLSFPKEYFYDEVRDGFYINGMMKRCWAAQLEILADIDEVCTRHGLRYMADWGTMMGAVRHGGYIPWDDDLDIGMPRADYEMFLKFADELGGEYLVLTHETDEYDDLFGRVVNAHAICLKPEFIEKYHGLPFSLGIDIFPYDYLYRDEAKENERRARYETVSHVISLLQEKKMITGEIRNLLRQIQKTTDRQILEASDVIKELKCLLTDTVSECPEEESDYIVDYQNYLVKLREYKLPKDIFNHLVAIDYELVKVPVPADYETVLRFKYGDFLRIVKAWSIHDYPYYEGQLEILREHIPAYYPKYEYVSGDLRFNNMSKISDIKGDVVFLPYRAGYWDSMRPMWEMIRSNPDVHAIVMPIPYYDKTWEGRHSEIHYEKDLFPDDVDVISIDEYDLVASHPSAIVIQDEKDDYGETMSVHPLFYSDRLRGCTDRLILIPPLEPDPPSVNDAKGMKSMDYFVNMPGVLRADTVYVTSEKMRDAYIRKLCQFCGDDGEQLFSGKIQVAPWSDLQSYGPGTEITYVDTNDAKKCAPEEWQQALQRPDGSYKRVILYEPDVSAMATHGEKMIDKIKRSLDTFRENSGDVCMIMRPVPDLESVLSVLDESEQGALLDILEEFASSGWGIWDPSSDSEAARRISDAYYGDVTGEVRRFLRAGKPVMLENPDV